MRLGALLGPVLDAGNGQALADQARALASAGYDSLWSAQAMGRGFMMSDPFVALTIAATAAPGMEVGTAVLQLPLYQTTDLAHRVFSLQQASGNKFVFGVGAGSTEKDFEAFERSYASRFDDFASDLARLRELLAEGKNDIADLTPWPAVKGGPPIFFGTWGKNVERAATEFDGWIASGAYRTADQVCDAFKRYKDAGGDRAIVSTLQITGETDAAEMQDKLARFAETGFDDAVVMLLPGAPDAATVRGWVA